MAIRATATVKRLFVGREDAFVALNIPAAQAPKDGWFTLKPDAPNYNAQYALALAAAANRWPLQVRIRGEEDISPEREAVVNFFVVDWDVADDTA
jgi:hypothetical protein